MIALSLEPDVERRLNAAALETGRSPGDLVVEALLARLDDLEDLRGAEAALADSQAGVSSSISLDDLERELALAHRI